MSGTWWHDGTWQVWHGGTLQVCHAEPLSSPTSSHAQPLSSPSCEETLCCHRCSGGADSGEAVCWASLEDGELLCSQLLSLLGGCLASSLLSSAASLP